MAARHQALGVRRRREKREGGRGDSHQITGCQNPEFKRIQRGPDLEPPQPWSSAKPVDVTWKQFQQHFFTAFSLLESKTTAEMRCPLAFWMSPQRCLTGCTRWTSPGGNHYWPLPGEPKLIYVLCNSISLANRTMNHSAEILQKSNVLVPKSKLKLHTSLNFWMLKDDRSSNP